MLLTLLLAFSFTFGSAASGLSSPMASMAMRIDTVSVASTARGFMLTEGHQRCNLTLHIAKHPQWRTSARYQLVFDSLTAAVLPEGTYELYLSAMPLRKKVMPESTDPAFLDVLNLYNARGDGSGYLSVNATRVVREWLNQPKLPQEMLYLTIVFKGNTVPGQAAAPHKGRLAAARVRLLAQW